MIETERLILRNWRPEDAEPFFRHLNKPAVMRWLGGVKTREFLDFIVHGRFIRWQEELGHTFWVMERKADGAFLGFCGLKIADSSSGPVQGEVEIGWRLREDAWGKGYAKEAAIASLDFAFQSLKAPRVIALTVAENKASWGLMERLGMTRRLDLDHEGPEWAPGIVIVYVLESGEWRV